MADASEKRTRSRIIAVAVDHSEWSEQAFEWFMENIHHEEDRIILIHVVEQLHLPFLADAMVLEEWKHEVQKIEEKLKAFERKYIERCKDFKHGVQLMKVFDIRLKEHSRSTLAAVGEHPRDTGHKLKESKAAQSQLEKKITLEGELIPMKFRVEEGKPGEKICEAALKEKAMLIVLGSRGSGVIRRTVLGSVSHYVIHHTKIPVVLCPRDHL